MPYKKSLEQLCLDTVDANYEAMQGTQLANQPSRITNSIFQRLLQSENTTRRLNCKHFIHAGSKSLDIRHFGQLDLPLEPVLDRIGQICHNLKHLNIERLQGYPEIPCPAVIKLLHHLPQIQFLNFRKRVEFTDQVVAEIGKKCPLLQSLSLYECARVTDRGVSCLSGCTKLEFLNIHLTGATPDGCFFVLNQLPLLKIFENHHWNELIVLFKQLESNKMLYTYSIQYVAVAMRGTSDRVIARIKAIFPNLCSLCLAVPTPTLQFNTTVVPILRNPQHDILKHLTRLCLRSIKLVNVRLIGRCCPLLEELNLMSCSIFDEDSTKCVPFKKLRQLGVSFKDTLVSELQLKVLLVDCPNVEHLEFRACESVTDELIAELVQMNAFDKLRYLMFWSCSTINVGPILKLLQRQNPLNLLCCDSCVNIDASAFGEIVNYVRTRKLDLRVVDKFDTNLRSG